MKHLRAYFMFIGLAAASTAHASIIRWDTKTVIPGTQNITPAPHVDLSNLQLQFALLNADFSSANFTNTNLHNARFVGATVTGATFDNANITNTHFDNLTSGGFTNTQLAGTANYKSQNLSRTTFIADDLAGWDFHNQNLTGSNFAGANLTNANLTNATITGATFNGDSGLRFSQIHSTANFAAHSLTGIHFNRENLQFWNLTHQDLSGDTFRFATLTKTYLGNANITGANFDGSTLTAAQLAATANYAKKDLTGITLSNLDLSNAKFRQQNLSNDSLAGTLLINANLAKANLSGANLTNADLAHATLTGANLQKTNLSDADLRDTHNFAPAASTIMTNTIRPNGVIRGLALKPNETLTIHNDPTPVTAVTTATFSSNSVLQFILGGNWSSPLRFGPAVDPILGGALDIEFPRSVDPSIFAGQSFQLFQWNSLPAASNRFTTLFTDPRVSFDTSELYITGVVTIASSGGNINPVLVPEPGSLALLATGAMLLAKRRR